MNKDSLILQLVAENVERQKAEEAEKQKSLTKWLGPGNHMFIENFFSPWKAKKSQREHEAILNKYTTHQQKTEAHPK